MQVTLVGVEGKALEVEVADPVHIVVTVLVQLPLHLCRVKTQQNAFRPYDSWCWLLTPNLKQS